MSVSGNTAGILTGSQKNVRVSSVACEPDLPEHRGMRYLICSATLLVALGGFALQAKSNHRKGPAIIAHLRGEAISASSLSVRSENGWDYLYVATPDGAVTVLNVSKPSKPSVARTLPAGETRQQLGDSLALVEDRAVTATQPTPSKIRVMNTSDSAHPRPIPELDGCTAYAVDRVRGLLYLSNTAGLWIVKDDSLVDPSVKIWEDFTKAP